jgi:hypothetical protein
MLKQYAQGRHAVGDSILIVIRQTKKIQQQQWAAEAGEHIVCKGSVGEPRGHVDRLGLRRCERTGSDEAIASERADGCERQEYIYILGSCPCVATGEKCDRLQ